MWKVKNEPIISSACAKELFESQELEFEIWDDVDDIVVGDHLYFDPDNDEDMDWLDHSDQYINILKKHKIKGDICFGSLEDGQFWGYRFDGEGGMQELVGHLLFIEEDAKRHKCLICGDLADHVEGIRYWCDYCVPMSGHYEFCDDACKILSKQKQKLMSILNE